MFISYFWHSRYIVNSQYQLTLNTFSVNDDFVFDAPTEPCPSFKG